MNINEILAKNIKYYRLKNNLSQEELANMCKLHRTYISSIELCKKSPTLKTIQRISKELNVEVYKLFILEMEGLNV